MVGGTQMLWLTDLPEGCRISQLSCRMQGDQAVLTWLWPENMQMVYIEKFFPDKGEVERDERRMKLYTREEYKAHSGYWDRMEGIGRCAYRVYPCQKQQEGLGVYAQEDEDSLLMFSSGKAAIRYSIRYGRSFFSKVKKARIEIVCEVPVPKEALCYVKKEGATPLSKDDGVAYPFIQHIAPGRNLFPEIEVARDSHLRIFLTDGKKYGDIYELIPV